MGKLADTIKEYKISPINSPQERAAKAGMPVFKFTKESIEVENKRKKYDEILELMRIYVD